MNKGSTMIIMSDIKDKAVIIISECYHNNNITYKIINKRENMRYMLKIFSYIKKYSVSNIVTISPITSNNLDIPTKSITSKNIMHACISIIIQELTQTNISFTALH